MTWPWVWGWMLDDAWEERVNVAVHTHYDDVLAESFHRRVTVGVGDAMDDTLVDRFLRRTIGNGVGISVLTSFRQEDRFHRQVPVGVGDGYGAQMPYRGPSGTPTIFAEDISTCGTTCNPTYRINVIANWDGDTISTRHIDRRVNGGAWTEVASDSFEDSDVTVGTTYEYRARLRRNEIDHTSDPSDEVVPANPCVTPGVPIVGADAQAHDWVRVQFDEVADGVFYEVYEASEVDPVATFAPEDAVHGTFTFDHFGRDPETQYCYTVVAYSAHGCSQPSAPACDTTPTAGPAAAPSDLFGVDASTCETANPTPLYAIGLVWANGDSSADTVIYRSDEEEEVAVVGPGESSYTDFGVSPSGGPYSYGVAHRKNSIESAAADIDEPVSVDEIACAPGPVAIGATDVSTCQMGCTPAYAVDVVVNRGSDTWSTLHVDRRVNEGAWDTDYASGSFQDTDVTAGNFYEYRARLTFNGLEESDVDGAIVFNPCILTPPPVSAQTISATVIRVVTDVVAAGHTTHIYRAPSTLIASLTEGQSQHDDEGRTPGTEYCYFAVSENSVGCESDPSGTDCATTWPLTPQGLSAALDPFSCPSPEVDVSWSNGGRNEAKVLERKLSSEGAGAWAGIASPGASDEGYRDDSVSAGNDYDYRIRFSSESAFDNTSTSVICPE